MEILSTFYTAIDNNQAPFFIYIYIDIIYTDDVLRALIFITHRVHALLNAAQT